MNRLEFIQSLTGLAVSDSLRKVLALMDINANFIPSNWEEVVNEFPSSNGIINLYGQAGNPAPKNVQEVFESTVKSLNNSPVYFYRTFDYSIKTEIRKRLSALMNCDAKEIAITRGTTEGLNNVIFGLRLNPGDEILTTSHDYYTAIAGWKTREALEGVKVRILNVPAYPDDPKEILEIFRTNITDRTKLIMFCHVDWTNGFINPAKEICQIAEDHGILTLIDGAHSFGQTPCDMQDIGCDFFVSSLHKWLYTTHGNGLMYIKSEKIPLVYPLFASGYHSPESDKIEKFEDIGTAIPNYVSIIPALDFLENIGWEKIYSRMAHLRNYWIERVSGISSVKMLTPIGSPHYISGFGYFELGKSDPLELIKTFRIKNNLITGCGMPFLNSLYGGYPDFKGIGISNPIYVKEADLDYLERVIRLYA
jgi:isopenicillin-N epimerase